MIEEYTKDLGAERVKQKEREKELEEECSGLRKKVYELELQILSKETQLTQISSETRMKTQISK